MFLFLIFFSCRFGHCILSQVLLYIVKMAAADCFQIYECLFEDNELVEFRESYIIGKL